MTHQDKNFLETKELEILHSYTGRELGKAYRSLLNEIKDKSFVVSSMSPALLVNLSLRGYEVPDSATRLESNKVIIGLDKIITSAKQKEQYWLMLAQQRDVILTKVEEDIESLLDSKMSKQNTQDRNAVLASIHKLIRGRTDKVVENLFNQEIAQPELPLEAA